MKKRVLSALLALCLTLSLAGAAFAENEHSGDSSSAVSQAVSSVESEPQTQDKTVSSGSASGEDQTTAKTESTPAPTETPAASDVAEEEPESTPQPEAATEPDTTPTPIEDPEAEVTEKTETDGSVEYTAALETDDQTLNVIVTAPDGAFAEGVEPQLSVTMLTAEDELNDVANKLTDAEVQYDGFAALDITFTDEATGEEVEPVKSVTVRIELPQTIVDSSIDLTTLAVQHLEEDENGNVEKVTEVATLDNGITLSEEAAAAANEAAGVAPMSDMPAEEATAGDAAETPAAVAEFSVDGFSTFTITWDNGRNYGREKYFTLNVHYVDTNGEEITVSNQDLPKNARITFPTADNSNRQNEYTSAQLDLTSYAITIPGYKSYTSIRFSNPVNGAEVKTATAILKGEWNWFFGYYFNPTGRSLEFKNAEGTIINTLNYTNTQSADIYIVYPAKEQTQEPEEPTTTAELQHDKWVEYNSTNDTYDLTLTVSGQVGSIDKPAKVDLLLIVDKSGSMAYSMRGGDDDSRERMQAVVNAVAGLTDTLSKNESVDVNYNLITFSSLGYSGSDRDTGWTKDTQTINNAVSYFVAQDWYDWSHKLEGGTNYQYAINKAKQQLNIQQNESQLGVREDARQIVIFLTDGVPTHRSLNYEQRDDSNSGFVNTKAATEELSGLQADDFYCIGIGNVFDSPSNNYDPENGKANLKKIQEAAKALGMNAPEPYSTSSSSALNTIFQQIAGSTTTYLCSGVKITDKLNKNVAVVDNNGDGTPDNLLIQVWNGDVGVEGNLVTSGQGSVNLPDPDQKGKTVTISAVYSAPAPTDARTNGTLELKFPTSYKLQQGYTYTVTTTVAATEDAYKEYRNNSCVYPDQSTTDKGSHAGENGLFSNVEAEVRYTYNGKEDSAPYDLPVIQLHPKSLTITKKIDGIDWEALQNNSDGPYTKEMYASQLSFKVTIGNAPEEVIPLSQFTYDQSSETYTLTIQGISPGASYTVEEDTTNVQIPGYMASDTPCKVEGKPSGNIPAWNGDNGITVGYTNYYEEDAPDTGNLTIAKQLVKEDGQSLAINNAPSFTFTITATGDLAEDVAEIKKFYAPAATGVEPEVVLEFGEVTGEGTSRTISGSVTVPANGSVTIENLPVGSYAVVENEPAEEIGSYYYSGNDLAGRTAQVEADKTNTLTVKNTYMPYRSIVITKDVLGEMGDTTAPFSFTTSVQRGKDKAASITSETTTINDEQVSAELHQNAALKEENRASFENDGYTLADGEYITISKLKDGDTITISETNANQSGYTTEYAINDTTIQPWVGSITLSGDNLKSGDSVLVTGQKDAEGNDIPITIGNEPIQVKVTNTRQVIAPTGLEDNHTKPFGLMVGVAVMAGMALVGGAVVRRRRRWME